MQSAATHASEDDKRRIMAAWLCNNDTDQIAKLLSLKEPVVANALAEMRDRRAGFSAVPTEHQKIKSYANKLRECGIPAQVIRLEVAKMEAAQ